MAFTGTAYGMSSAPSETWRTEAACRDTAVDPDIFFNDSESFLGRSMSGLAKSVCARCPVVDICRAWVADHPQEFGVWAGMTTKERRMHLTPGARFCKDCGSRFNRPVTDPFRRQCPTCIRAESAKRQAQAKAAAAQKPGSYWCKAGHELTAANVRLNVRGKHCKQCNTEAQAKRRAEMKAVKA